MVTLTSGPSSPLDIHRSFRRLVARIRRRFDFQYFCVQETTQSGLVHLHLLYRGSFIPQAWLSQMWQTVHNAQVVWIARIKRKRGCASYLCKYLSKEVLGRCWSSWEWIYRGWRWAWSNLKDGLGRSRLFRVKGLLVELWRRHLEGEGLWLNGLVFPPPREMRERYVRALKC